MSVYPPRNEPFGFDYIVTAEHDVDTFAETVTNTATVDMTPDVVAEWDAQAVVLNGTVKTLLDDIIQFEDTYSSDDADMIYAMQHKMAEYANFRANLQTAKDF